MISTIIVFGYLIWNIYCFGLMYSDKQLAIKGEYRISERRLILSAFIFGAFGTAFGMMAFHHKTNKPEFIFKVIVCIIANMAELCVMMFLL